MHNNEADASARRLSSCPRGCVSAIKGRCMQIKVSLSRLEREGFRWRQPVWTCCVPASLVAQKGPNFRDGEFQGNIIRDG